MNKRKYVTMLKQKQYRNIRNKNGITLIALVITIIIMVILAGVSLNATIGDNGIISNAQYSTFVSEMTDLGEALKTWQTSRALNDDDYDKKAPTNGLCTPEELQQAKRLMGEVGYYRVWNITDSKPILDLTETSESFDNKYESEFIYYPAGIQDLYYLNNETLGINKKKKYLIDAATGIIYSLNGINLKGVQCYSLEMAKTVMEGYTDIPSFAELEISGGKNAGNVSNKYKVDENGNYVLDGDGNKIENSDYNPYGFEIITSQGSNNIYKLYNNGDLYGKGIKSIGLDSTKDELESISGYVWTELNIPNSIPNYKKIIMGKDTILVIDNDKNVWAWGNNSSNKLGLTEEQLKEYTGREPIKLNLTDNTGKKIDFKEIYCYASSMYIVSTSNEVYACGSNKGPDGDYGVLGIGSTEAAVGTFYKCIGLPQKNIKYISENGKWFTPSQVFVIYEDNEIYICGSGYRNSVNHKTFEKFLDSNYFSSNIKDFTSTRHGISYFVLENGDVYRMTSNTNIVKVEELNNIESVQFYQDAQPVVFKDKSGEYYYYSFLGKLDSVSLGIDKDKLLVEGSTTQYKTCVKVSDIVPTNMLQNDKIKEIQIIGHGSGLSTYFYIMESGKVWGTGQIEYLGLGKDYIDNSVTNVMSEIKLIYDGATENNLAIGITSKKINSTSNEIIVSNCEDVSPLPLIGDDGKVYITADKSIMYGNKIIQNSWKKIASNVKNFYIGNNNEKIAYTDVNGNTYVALDNIKDIGEESVTKNVEVGNNFRKIICLNNEKIEKLVYGAGSIHVLTDKKNLYTANRGKYDTSWVNESYNGINDSSLNVLTLLDSNIEFLTATENNRTEIAYVKDGIIKTFGSLGYAHVYESVWNYYSNTPVDVKTISNEDLSQIKKMTLISDGSITVLNDGNVYLSGDIFGVHGYRGTNTNISYNMRKYTYNELGLPSKIKDAVFYASGIVFLCEDGKIYGMGTKDKLGLGNNSTEIQTTCIYLGIDNVIQISANPQSCTVVKKDCSVYGTGYNTYGILGRWIGVDRKTPNSRYKTALNWVECPELEI